jgi:hypothetical protein
MPAEPLSPEDLKEDLTAQIDFCTEVAETRVDPARCGEEYEDLSRYYRALGICQLSGDADIDGFFHHLIQSALARRHYLDGVKGGGEPRHRRASFLDPALDAIAARQWKLAGELFSRVAHSWTEGEEYEDDFCYAEVIRRLTTDDPEPLDPLLAHWEEVLEGGEDRRLEVAKALIARDAASFTEALAAHLSAEDAKARAIADPEDGSSLADEPPFFPNHWVSIEGLALLALAEKRGMEVQELFKGCPAPARAGVFGPFRSLGYPYAVYTNE